MGFRCEVCGNAVEPGINARKLVVAKRMKEYPYRREVHRKMVLDEKGRLKEKWTDDVGGLGWEIARELMACHDCAHEFEIKTKKDAAMLKTG